MNILAIGGVLVGAWLVIGPGLELLKMVRTRGTYVRVPGVIVGRRDARGEQGRSPGTHSRAAIFRFTTKDGRVIEAESDVQSVPGPKPGTRVTVIYDPRKPHEAETTGRFAITAVVVPAMMIGGVVLIIVSLAELI